MPKKSQLIYQLHFNFDSLVELEFAVHHDNRYKSDSKTIQSLKKIDTRRPLLTKWKPISVVRNDSNKADFVMVDTNRIAVSEKARTILHSEYGDSLEFLPITVVGKIVERDDDDVLVPAKKPETFYLLNSLVTMKLGKQTKFTKYPACREYSFVVFDGQQVDSHPIFSLPFDWNTYATTEFKRFVESKKLKGLAFDRDRLLDWSPTATPTPTSVKKSKAQVQNKLPKKATKKTAVDRGESLNVAPTKSIETLLDGPHQRMSVKLWKAILDSCNWCCDVAQQLNEKPVRPKASKPISSQQLQTLRKKVGQQLPTEFEQVLLKFAGKFQCYWALPEPTVFLNSVQPNRKDLLVTLAQESKGGGDCLWDVKLIKNFVSEAKKNNDFARWLHYQDGSFGFLPFLSVGDGDLIGFDMRSGHKHCPVVYLCHDDAKRHATKIGDNFIDFLANWASLGFIGPDFSEFEPFLNRRLKKLSGGGTAAKRWRKSMEMQR